LSAEKVSVFIDSLKEQIILHQVTVSVQ